MRTAPSPRALLVVAVLALLGVAVAPAMASAAPPEVLLPEILLTETDAGRASTTVNVALDRPNPYPFPVAVVVQDKATGSATSGSDYVPIPSRPVVWWPGQRIASFPVTLLGDDVTEAHETIRLRLTAPIGVSIVDSEMDLVIGNNDPLGMTGPLDPPLISLPNVHIPEGDAGCDDYRVTLLLSRPAPAAGSVGVVDYTSVGVPGANPPRTYGAATPGVDYMSFPEFSLPVPRGATSVSFPVLICGDRQTEGDEEIDIRIVAPVGLDIIDNDLDLILDNED